MKIAYIVPSLVNKGPIVVVHTIVKNIVDKVDLVHVYYFDDDFVLEFPCQTYKLTMDRPINFDDYDVIHTHGYRPDKYISNWKKRIKKAKTVCTIHSDIAQDLKFSYNKLISCVYTPFWLRMMKSHDAVAVISGKLETLYKKKFKSLYKIYNGVDIDLDESKIDAAYDDKINEFRNRNLSIIGTYAAISKRKGIDQIIQLLKIRTDLALVCIGEGNEIKSLLNLAKTIGVYDRVIFFPYLKNPYNYIHLFDVYVMPSRSEGFGLALVEAALANAAIVCSDIEVFHEIFNENEVTFFELENINSLDLAVKSALQTKKLKSVNAYKKANKYFSGEIMGLNYLEFYKKII